jgi:NAD(P)-dependent dehydrogenase (short-subunit alcohol dehydrogenase family)
MPASSRGNVFITGAAAGIGAAATRQLAAGGYTVFAGVHKDTGALDRIAGVRQVPIDVTDPHSVAAAAALVTDLAGERGLHALINNAGIIVQGPLELVTPEDLRLEFAVNTLGPAFAIQSFLPLLRAGGGRVINISAPTARVPMPFLGALSASKAALNALSDAIRPELRAWRIPVVVIEPGATDTQIFAKAVARTQVSPGRTELYQDRLEAVAAAAARQRTAPADKVARTIVTAVRARSPKRHYTSGPDARLAGMVASLPAGLRERLIVRLLGLRDRR